MQMRAYVTAHAISHVHVHTHRACANRKQQKMAVLRPLLEEYGGSTLCGVVLCVIASYYFLLYPLILHPLARVPGPKSAALTQYWILYISWAEKRNATVHRLHEKYGPIVRIGPNEVDISDPSYIKDVYVDNFDKSSFYAQFGVFGQLNSFSTVTKRPHLVSRKQSTKGYSKSAVSAGPTLSMVQSHVSRAVDKIASHTNQTIDIYSLFQAMAMDVIASFSFGDSAVSLLSQSKEHRDHILTAFRLQSSLWFWVTSMPRWAALGESRQISEASKTADEFLLSQYNKCLEESDGKGPDGSSVQNLLAAGKSRMAAISEIADHLAAGYQTTGITLSYLFWEVAKHDSVQEKLAEELCGTGDLAVHQLDDLPYLNAVLEECFRLHAAIPGQEPRVSPQGGFNFRQTTFIPEQTVVTMQPYTLHRDQDVFPDPEAFIPERWHTDDAEKLKQMKRCMFTFGAGVRMCIGMNLATLEMKLAMVSVVSRFRVKLSPGVDYTKQMQMADKYTTHPMGNKCELVFEVRE